MGGSGREERGMERRVTEGRVGWRGEFLGWRGE